jgi:hypothetical protein
MATRGLVNAASAAASDWPAGRVESVEMAEEVEVMPGWRRILQETGPDAARKFKKMFRFLTAIKDWRVKAGNGQPCSP